MSGTFYLIGVGPGDPELMTMKACRVLMDETDVVGYPGVEARTGVAFEIAVQAVPQIKEKEQLPLRFPMTTDQIILSSAHEAAVQRVKCALDQGKTASFLTLGDPSVYSTASYLGEAIRSEGYTVEMISGVPSFCAAAAKLLLPIASGNEQVQIIPSEEFDVSFPGTMILMKVGNHLPQIKKKISDSGRKAYLFENCGMPGEQIYSDIHKMPDRTGYYSLMIVK